MSDSNERSGRVLSRRAVGQRAVEVGSAVVVAGGVVDVARGDTPSGNVEVEVAATVPAAASADITVFEDTSGDGSADRQQSKSISDGTSTYEYDLLTATVAQGHELWVELSLSTTDDSVTPEIDRVTITLPEADTGTSTPTPTDGGGGQPETNPVGIGGLWRSYEVFVSMVVLAFAVIGMWGRSLSLGAFLAYLAFAYLAVTTGTPLFENILYVTIVLVFIGFAFKLWRLEMGGE